MQLSYKLLEQGYVGKRLKSSLMKLYGRYGDLNKPSPKCYMTFWGMTVYSDTLHWLDITLKSLSHFTYDFSFQINFASYEREEDAVWQNRNNNNIFS